jgi:hypothetical protein
MLSLPAAPFVSVERRTGAFRRRQHSRQKILPFFSEGFSAFSALVNGLNRRISGGAALYLPFDFLTYM